MSGIRARRIFVQQWWVCAKNNNRIAIYYLAWGPKKKVVGDARPRLWDVRFWDSSGGEAEERMLDHGMTQSGACGVSRFRIRQIDEEPKMRFVERRRGEHLYLLPVGRDGHWDPVGLEFD